MIDNEFHNYISGSRDLLADHMLLICQLMHLNASGPSKFLVAILSVCVLVIISKKYS